MSRRLAGLAALCALGVSAGAGRAAPAAMIGFYAPWDPASAASLQRHGRQLRAVVATWISVTGPGHKLRIDPDPDGRVVLAGLGRPPQLWLMAQNAFDGAWDGPGAAALLRDPAATSRVLDGIEQEGVRDRASGLVVDLESLPPGAQPDLIAFLAAARERCRRHGWILAVTAPVDDPTWNLAALARASDRVILMAYDQHWQSGPPGPIAADDWFAAAVKAAAAQIGPRQTLVAIASYAYDWPEKGPATVLSISQAEALAARHGVRPERDPQSGAAHFSYAAGGETHRVWLADAASVRAQSAIAAAAGAQGIALWRLGTEDPAIWSPENPGRR